MLCFSHVMKKLPLPVRMGNEGFLGDPLLKMSESWWWLLPEHLKWCPCCDEPPLSPAARPWIASARPWSIDARNGSRSDACSPWRTPRRRPSANAPRIDAGPKDAKHQEGTKGGRKRRGQKKLRWVLGWKEVCWRNIFWMYKREWCNQKCKSWCLIVAILRLW